MEMMSRLNKHILIAAATLSVITVNAREKAGSVFRTSATQKVMAGCSPAQSAAELTVNNVRTIIYSGSDMWWDLFGTGNAWYAVPKVEDKAKFQNSCFAGNVWFGGLDVGGQLKIAAQTYRQGGIDFWSGPLSTVDASITQDVCSKYDKIFTMSREHVDNYILADGEMTSDIANWPGNGDLSLNQDPQLAPYFDGNGNGVYDPENRMDYPYYDIYNNAGFDNLGVCKARVFGDETLWWVYNDNGGVHQATGGKAIGMEVRAQAFAFKTTDEINNMTFYNYQIINRSSFSLLNTYMTVWTDADLGQYSDDYIGCDVKRGLGYIYNGDSYDETAFGVNGYLNYIPALGCDFFQGPINTTDGVDNDGDGPIDEPGEQMGMTKFLYFNNSLPGFPTQTTDPQTAAQYYQYMTGFWRDGTPFTCGGNAYGGSVSTSYVYPSDTYTTGPCGASTWDDTGVPGDRRFMQSSGPFTLEPGAVNYVTFGLPWARTTAANSPKSSIPLLKIADDKAQALFDNCFKVLSGPEAPDMTIQEMSNELIIYFSNKPGSNNYLNQYLEKDVSIIVDTTHYYPVDKFYHMEGFKVYQLKNESVVQEELHDQSKAKLVFSCDVNNGVQRLINYEYDAATGGDIAVDKTEGQIEFDKGLKSTFHFTQDQFSLASDKKVVNNKQYYFFCVAYGYNQYGQYKEDAPFTAINVASSEGQKRPYLEGRKSKKAYGIPHIPDPEKEGSITNSVYGYGPKVTRLEGQGNGGNILDLTQESIDKIVANGGRTDVITYENGRGPLNIKVVDPLNVPNSTFSFKFINRNWFYQSGLSNAQINDTINLDPCRSSDWHKSFPYPLLTKTNTQYGQIVGDSATWVLTDLSTNKEYYPCKAIKIAEEYYFSDLGLSLNIGQSRDVANVNVPSTIDDKVVEQADLLEGTISFADPSSPWLVGLPDTDGESPFNWIRSGTYKNETNATQNDYIASAAISGTTYVDPNGVFEGVLNGTWAPYYLTASSKTGSVLAAPGYSASASTSGLVSNAYDLRGLASVDIVLTKDKSKWTHCLVLEECDENVANPTGAKKLEARRSKCVDKQGIPLGEPGCNTAEALVDSIPSGGTAGQYFQYGLGWFPGYAINLETGERLNIAFGEDSYQNNSNTGSANNGGDMIWNPTASGADFSSGYPYTFGGRHYIYVFGHNRSSMTYSISSGVNASITGKPVGVGTYSQFADFAYTYKTVFANNNNNMLNNIWSEAMWVNIPLLSDSRYAFTNPADMPCDAKVRLRVKKSYKYGMSGVYTNTLSAFRAGTLGSPIYEGTTGTPTYYTRMTTDTLPVSVNNNFGYYTFNTADIFTEIANADKLKSGLDLINVVPNPYYAYSTYEANRTDTRVRITNLPNKCKIKIFTLNGTLVRTFDRDVSGQEDELEVSNSDFKHSRRLPYQDWDLKNQNGITVASGLYIIHIDVPGVGEKILKWFGVMRPLDLQNY
jgi:hypothetical protein